MKTRMTRLFAVLILLAASGSVFAQHQRTDIHPDANDVQPLLPGMMAPAFDVLDAQGQGVQFDPENMANPLVLSFFRGGWCPYCNLHLAEMRKAESELRDMASTFGLSVSIALSCSTRVLSNLISATPCCQIQSWMRPANSVWLSGWMMRPLSATRPMISTWKAHQAKDTTYCQHLPHSSLRKAV